MSEYQTNAPYCPTAATDRNASGLRALLGRIAKSMAEARRAASRRRSARQLMELDGHLLDDAGIKRRDIRVAVRDGRPYA